MKKATTECHNRVSKYVTNENYEQFRAQLSHHSQTPAKSYRVNDVILRGKEQNSISGFKDYSEKYIVRTLGKDEMLLIKEASMGNKVKETVIPISSETAEQILEGHTKWLCASISPILRELGVKMTTARFSPDAVLNFIRECFTINGKLKITADSSISVSDFCPGGVLCPSGVNLEPVDSGIRLLQINYDRIIPEFITSMFKI